VHLAGDDVEVDALERAGARVVLDEAADLEDGLAHLATSIAATSTHACSRAEARTASVIRAARRPSANTGIPSGATPSRTAA
jgi:hypothetical protein